MGEQLADKLRKKVSVEAPDGTKRMVSAYELIVEKFVEALPTAKPREIMMMLQWMEKLSVFDNMHAMAVDPSANPFADEHQEWRNSADLTRAIAQMGSFGSSR